MPCACCSAQFSILKWKSRCSNCFQLFCSDCSIGRECRPCCYVNRCKSSKTSLMQIKVKDLQGYLKNFKIEHRTCKEKHELVKLIQNQFGITSSENIQPPSSYTTHDNRANEDQRRDDNSDQNQSENSSTDDPAVHLPTPPTYQRTQESFPTAEQFNVSSSGNDSSIATPIVIEDTEESTSTHNNANTVENNEVTEETSTSYAFSSPAVERTAKKTKIGLSEIKSVQEIESYSIKQLKTLLQENLVNYKGVLERTELVNRVKNLYEDHVSNESNISDDITEENSSSYVTNKDELFCKICWERPRDCVLLECAHMSTCITCGKQLRECPICRQHIVRAVRVFKS
uniref:E3 ubiquitin-protein ligase RNF34-like n=1 Tax=Ciona intestinalis TaxID=7719 RepID=UPI000180B42A|nr:E3 ubiquitin-protein ligase RNF34-like [Ciona intestinalis]|eukprot:XP_002121907.3 E3 ubiquitin-protein ligase RNF34-like [Ciona intestinalis]